MLTPAPPAGLGAWLASACIAQHWEGAPRRPWELLPGLGVILGIVCPRPARRGRESQEEVPGAPCRRSDAFQKMLFILSALGLAVFPQGLVWVPEHQFLGTRATWRCPWEPPGCLCHPSPTRAQALASAASTHPLGRPHIPSISASSGAGLDPTAGSWPGLSPPDPPWAPLSLGVRGARAAASLEGRPGHNTSEGSVSAQGAGLDCTSVPGRASTMDVSLSLSF